MPFPIKVEEDSNQYYVSIPANQKLRASGIAGRRWLPDRKVWVYPRTQSSYNDLYKEFNEDADTFSATPPAQLEQTQKPTAPFTFETLESIRKKLKIDASAYTEKKDETDDDSTDDVDSIEEAPLVRRSLEAAGEDLTQLQNKADSLIAHISELTETIGEIKGDLIVIKDTNSNIVEVVEGLQQQPEAVTEPTKHESLDPDNLADLRLMEHALVSIAVITSKNDPSFKLWLSNQAPLLESYRFINETNEHLKRKLADFLGKDNASRISFFDLIGEASKFRLLTVNDSIHVPQMLRSLNAHRNCFAHPNMNRAEIISRAITYLHTAALIWSEFASDQVD